MDADATVGAHASALADEAAATGERRLLVLAGDRATGLDVAGEAAGDHAPTLVSDRTAPWAVDRVPPADADELLGATRPAVVLDAHSGFAPTVLGRVVGTVDGGGLFVLVVPRLDEWPDATTDFDRTLAVPPFEADDVGGRFRRRLVATFDHPGVSVVDLATGELVRDGRTGATDRRPTTRVPDPPPGDERAFPAAAYEAAVTGDQHRAVRALEGLADGEAVVVEADRGRGKSAAAGLAAGALARDGEDVLVTAPDRRGADELFARARAVLAELDALADADDDVLRSTAGGRVRYRPAVEAVNLPGDPDAVVVDEAAGLPVHLLAETLAAPAVAYVTTVHGYEGAGRGFAVRFRDRLAESGRTVTDVELAEPVRYAPDDPVESWAFRALLLDADPAVGPAVEGVRTEDCAYEALDPDELAADDHLLREVFGLLALAHYRTEPDDLARLLDAPNVAVRALCAHGHVVSVALLAREGGLDADLRRRMYDGERVRGNMIPDVLTTQLRDEAAGEPVGYRVLRIATHEAVRSRGLGSRLCDEVADEFGDEADWLGVGFGATPRLLRFWARNDYATVHIATTRNERSGEYSAVMLRPTSPEGRRLHDRHATRFLDRAGGVLAGPLDDCDPDVVRSALDAVDPPDPVSPDLTDHEWRVVAAAAFGPGIHAAAPDAFRDLAVAALVDHTGLDARAERLLVRAALQHREWTAVATAGGYPSRRTAMLAFGEAYRPLVDRYGGTAAEREADRYRGSD